jgi:hypothetical protein
MQIDHQLTYPLSREEYETVLDGKQFAIFLWGRVEYFDAFGIERHLTYRYQLGGAEQFRVGVMHLSPYGNEAD